MQDYYRILGVSPDAEAEVIIAAYKALIRKYHPDHNRSAKSDVRARELNEAYEVLRSPSKRQEYDNARNKAEDNPPPPNSQQSRSRDANLKNAQLNPIDRSGISLSIAAFLTAIAMIVGAYFYGSSKIAGAYIAGNSTENAQDAHGSSIKQTGNDYASNYAMDTNDPSNEIEQDENSTSSIPDQGDEFISKNRAGSENLTQEQTPTFGQFYANINSAVKNFAEIHKNEGMTGAKIFSKECNSTLKISPDILKTDYCIAFDMAAISVDFTFAKSINMPMDEYFQSRSRLLDQDYNRFNNASPNRIEIIWSEVNSTLPIYIK